MARRPLITEREERASPPSRTRSRERMRAVVARTDSTFFGRARELEALEAIEASVVSLVGAPGMGKSRLAREWAPRARGDGRSVDVHEVALSAARTEDDVVAALASALGVSLAGDPASATDRLTAAVEALGDAVVLFDDADGSLDALRALLPAWAARAPCAMWIVTAAERIDPTGCALEVGPLALDARFGLSDAARLFAARARAVAADFTCSDDDVEDLVRALDGSPLAIELAAAQVGVVTPRQILERHATSESPLDRVLLDAWSTLDEDARRVLGAASVFAGGFDLEAAEAVLSPEVDGSSVIAVLGVLYGRSLLRSERDAHGEPRFSLYECIRIFARRMLASGREAVLEARHGAHYFARARAGAPRWDGPDEAATRDALDRDRANLVAAMSRALARGATDARDVLEAALAIDPLLAESVPLGARLRNLDAAIAACEGRATDEPLARAYAARAEVLCLGGDLARARLDAGRALVRARTCGSTKLEGRATAWLGVVDMCERREEAATAALERALALHRAAGDVVYEGRSIGWLGTIALMAGRIDGASSLFERAIVLHVRAGDRRYEGANLGNLASAACESGATHEAAALADRAVALHQRRGDRRLAAICAALSASIHYERAHLTDAHQAFLEAERVLDDTGEVRIATECRIKHGMLLAESGDVEAARDLFERVLRASEWRDEPTINAVAVAGLAVCDALTGCAALSRAGLDRARAKLRGAKHTGVHGGAYEALVETFAAHVDLARADEAWADGDDAARTRHLDAAAERVARSAPHRARSMDVRLAARWVEQRVAHARDRGVAPADGATTLSISVDGRWFRPPGGALVSLERHAALARVLACLAAARQAAGEPVPAVALVRAGWPDERLLPRAARLRLHNALSRLRTLGLRDALVRSHGGYAIAPSCPCVVV